MTTVHTFLSRLASRMSNNHIWRDSGQIYMARYFTTPTQEQANWFLHNIRLSDGDGHHSHPYSWQFSLILSGHYEEETLDTQTGVITTRTRRWFNWIPGTKFHRITRLSRTPVWTIFIHGPKTGKSWGFWLPEVGYVHNQSLGIVKIRLDQEYWTRVLAPSCYHV